MSLFIIYSKAVIWFRAISFLLPTLLLTSKVLSAQSFTLIQVERIVDSSLDYATDVLSETGWEFHGQMRAENAIGYSVYQWWNEKEALTRQLALYVNNDAHSIDMFLESTPDQRQYQKLLNELTRDKKYRIDTTILGSKSVKKRYISTYYDNKNHIDELQARGLKVLTLSERTGGNSFGNRYYIQMEVQHRVPN